MANDDLGYMGGPQFELSGKARSERPSTDIARMTQEAVNDTLGPGYAVHVFSGQEPAGRSPFGAANRHPRGFAADFYVTDPKGKVVSDDASMKAVAMAMAARHNANIGYDNAGYMGKGRMHVDIMPLSQFPGGAQWGKTAKAWAAELEDARSRGLTHPAAKSNLPVPSQRPAQDTASAKAQFDPAREALIGAQPGYGKLTQDERLALGDVPVPTRAPRDSLGAGAGTLGTRAPTGIGSDAARVRGMPEGVAFPPAARGYSQQQIAARREAAERRATPATVAGVCLARKAANRGRAQ